MSLHDTTYDTLTDRPRAGRTVFMADLAATLLPLRHRLPDRAIVDLLDLADYLQLPQGTTSPVRLVTTAELASRFSCDASTIRRRMRVLCRHGLLDATNRSGPKAEWKIKRVGPGDMPSASAS